MVCHFGTPEDRRHWRELFRDDIEKTARKGRGKNKTKAKQASISVKDDSEGNTTKNNNQILKSPNPEIIWEGSKLVRSTKLPKRVDKTRKLTQQEMQQTDTITEKVKKRLNRYNQIVRNNVLEMMIFIPKSKRNDSFILIKDWLLNNIQSNGKRIIILLHLNKNWGFEWNAYNKNIDPLWQRKWEKVLELDNEGMHVEIKTSESIKKTIKRLYNVMNPEGDKCTEDAMKEAFYATQL